MSNRDHSRAVPARPGDRFFVMGHREPHLDGLTGRVIRDLTLAEENVVRDVLQGEVFFPYPLLVVVGDHCFTGAPRPAKWPGDGYLLPQAWAWRLDGGDDQQVEEQVHQEVEA